MDTPPRAPEHASTDAERTATARRGRIAELAISSAGTMDKPYRRASRRDFGRYELLIEMGRGGMATLYLARLRGPQQFEKLLAIKKIHDHLADEAHFVDMFLDEARLAARIQHPNVATVFEFGELESTYFMAMEYVHGQNLTDVLKAAVRSPHHFPWTHAVRLVAEAAAGLHAAHELRRSDGTSLEVVHRDVSPQNILISYDGHVKMVDFGIAYAAEKLAHTSTGTVKGKAAYMSPEQTMAEPLDRRSDIYSLGIVLWETVCLQRLFRRETDTATLLEVREGKVPRPRTIQPAIPQELEAVLLKALALERGKRFDTAEEFAEGLTRILINQGEMVGRQQVETLMDRLFRERRQFKEEQIQQSMNEHSAPLPGVAMTGSASASLQVSRVIANHHQRRTQLLIATAVVGVVLGVVALAYLMFGRASPTQRRTTPASDRTRSGTIELRVQVTPAHGPVTIQLGSRKHRTSRLRLTLRRSNTPERLVIRAPGHRTETLLVVPNQDLHLPVRLTPVVRQITMTTPPVRLGPRPALRRPALRRRPRRSRPSPRRRAATMLMELD